MKNNMKTMFMALVITFVGFVSVSEVEAVPDPSAIQWGASAQTFVGSLYEGVLGRAPESSEVVTAWASNITGNSNTRLRVFWGFINSSEYQSSSWAGLTKNYIVYQRLNRNDTYTYTVSAGRLGPEWRPVLSRQTFGVALAVRGYYATLVPDR